MWGSRIILSNFLRKDLALFAVAIGDILILDNEEKQPFIGLFIFRFSVCMCACASCAVTYVVRAQLCGRSSRSTMGSRMKLRSEVCTASAFPC